VTQAVVEWLSGDYEVEPGHGANRSEYLYKHNVTTYLITDNQSRMKVRSQGHRPYVANLGHSLTIFAAL